MPGSLPSRRTVLVVGAAGAGAVALAACSSKAKSTSTTSAPGAPLARLSDITVGQAVSATLADGTKAIVARPTEATAAAFSAKCTHMGCTVAPTGPELHCPCHGSVYNAVTGEVISGPAPSALAKIAVHVAGGEVLTGGA